MEIALTNYRRIILLLQTGFYKAPGNSGVALHRGKISWGLPMGNAKACGVPSCNSIRKHILPVCALSFGVAAPFLLKKAQSASFAGKILCTTHKFDAPAVILCGLPTLMQFCDKAFAPVKKSSQGEIRGPKAVRRWGFVPPGQREGVEP